MRACAASIIAMGVLSQGAALAQPASVGLIDGYPDWSGQWSRIGGLTWPPEGYDEAGPPPLTDEYQAIWEEHQARQEAGIPAGDPPSTCLPPGMPRMMKMSYPMEIIITPNITYIYGEWASQFRRVYTDGRDWPGYILPSFNGYSIGDWSDANDDGVFDTLTVETRGIAGPRSFDSRGVPLHEDGGTIVHERIRLLDDDTLLNEITTIDAALREPWTIEQRYSRTTDDIIWTEYVCAENNRHLQLGDDWYFIGPDGTLEPTEPGQPRLVPERETREAP